MARVAAARRAAYTVIRRVFEDGAYADRVLHAVARDLDQRDRALAMTLAYGTVQRRATLDYVAAKLASRPPGELEPAVLNSLRLGLFQLLLLDAVADYAAVNDSVELIKRSSPGGAKLVNAVLRRAARDGRALLDGLDDEQPQGAAVLHSVPDWLAQRWWDELGSEQARALLRRINEPAESALRVNTLVATPATVARALAVPATRAPGLEEGLITTAPFDAHASDLFEAGAIMPQSRASMLVSRVLDPQPGERILDLCAAPGAKTTHLAALTANDSEILAVERNPRRAQALEQTCVRMHADSVRVRTADAAGLGSQIKYDRVLVDPPCSGLGTLQSRPDLRWRATPDRIDALTSLQTGILAAAASATAPRGTLVYSVCTISCVESGQVIDSFLSANPDFSTTDLNLEYPAWADPNGTGRLQLLPHRDGTDGFFIARLARR
jgi:16S rRNA (cytosine967-C5)-methyltransferase